MTPGADDEKQSSADTSVKCAVDTSTGDDWETEADELQRVAQERAEAYRKAKAEAQAKAAANVRRVVDEDMKRQKEEFDAMLERVVRKAEQQTGLTREQMLAMPTEPTTPPLPVSVSREQVKNRGVPERHIRAVFDQPPVECDALAAVRRFLDADQQVFLVLSGGVGTRKSGSACWALTRISGLYVKADDLGRVAGARDEESLETWRAVKRVSLLVIDDLGAEFVDDKGWFLRAITAVIDSRYESLSKTIVTTNLDAAAFKTRYGERLVDRIRECGEFYEVAGESIRGK